MWTNKVEELLTDENPSSLLPLLLQLSLFSSTSSLFFIFILFALFTFFTLLNLFSPLIYLHFFWKGFLNHLLTLPETTTQRPFEKTTYSIFDNCSFHPTIVSRFDYSVKQSWAGSLYELKTYHKFQMLSTLEYKLCSLSVFVFSFT